MAVFIISYDLQEPNSEEDYKKLYDELDSMGAQRIQKSVWAVRTDSDSDSISYRLRKFVHDEDRLLVSRIYGFKNVNGINSLKAV
jgi:CRISPR-associated endonuclease Cas2